MTKETLIEAVNDLPQNFGLNVLLEKLVVIEKIQKGLDQLEQGDTLTHLEVKQQIKEWRK